jgi:hypothetical protein
LFAGFNVSSNDKHIKKSRDVKLVKITVIGINVDAFPASCKIEQIGRQFSAKTEEVEAGIVFALPNRIAQNQEKRVHMPTTLADKDIYKKLKPTYKGFPNRKRVQKPKLARMRIS